MSSGLDDSYLQLGPSSFLDFLRSQAPTLAAQIRESDLPSQAHATTIAACATRDCVVMAGDRRATTGTTIAHRELEKVFPADDASVIGIAGAAGIGLDLVKLFQLEVEHYEKIEGTRLSLQGKANRLAHLVRDNLELAARGLVAVPLFAGVDDAGESRLFSYDAAGGCYRERDYAALGSGAVYARSTLKAHYRATLTETESIALALRSLIDAADEDSATAGIDRERGILPVVAVVTSGGYRRVSDQELAGLLPETEAGS